MTDNRLAGLVLALAALAVVSALAVRDLARSAPARVASSTFHPSEALAPAAAPEEPARKLAFPLRGRERVVLRDNFDEPRGKRRHQALDIMAPRGTEVVAVDDGRVARLYRHPLGGLTVYQLDAHERYVYFYAHLDRYAPGLAEGMSLARGDLIGYVGTTGNAPEGAPHLHFAAFELGEDRRWWKGRPVNPYPWLK